MLYTIGHSTRTQDQLVALLRHYGVDLVLDIRIIPMSRYNPQFNRDVIARVLPESGIAYEHCPALGGIKPSSEVMLKAKSCSERSRGFGEFMKTETFQGGIRRALQLAREHTLALMCAESDPVHCHRFLVSDALTEHGEDIRHIVTEKDLRTHPANLFSF